MNQFISEGYEGAVIRARDSDYVFSYNARRSNTTLKYKRRLDIEVQVVAFTQGQARDSGAIVFICEYNGHRFNVVQNTTVAQRKLQFAHLLKNPEQLNTLKLIPLTIEHSGLSDLGVPQQPRGIQFRYDLIAPELARTQIAQQLTTMFT